MDIHSRILLKCNRPFNIGGGRRVGVAPTIADNDEFGSNVAFEIIYNAFNPRYIFSILRYIISILCDATIECQYLLAILLNLSIVVSSERPEVLV